ncbi:outer membrane porin, OprD family [Corallincola luteus]|uniref:Outer membrane porin, OprD family n=1 Tax=Corallincola luteus TaxID=1775177 RepID=A0ABY2ALV5_9GAMM|nr:OprD family outer membrane porin [Corallincola luteus]TCI03945.1 outer membrane porin, OprD family [Corallincola luteus]
MAAVTGKTAQAVSTCATLICLSVLLLSCSARLMADDRAPTVVDKDFADELADKSSMQGLLSYMQRKRKRRDESGQSNRFKDDLNHGTLQTTLKFKSGWLYQQFGVNLSAFGATDLTYDDELPRNIENEFSFAGERWSDENSSEAESGVSVSRAVLKYRTEDKQFRVKAGYAPMHVPGIIGVNWSFQPGTYRGVQAKYTPQNWTVTYAWADEYKAPWYLKTQHFSKVNAWDPNPVSGDNRIDYIHGLSANYQPPEADWSLAFSAGQSADYVDAYFFKLAKQWAIADGLSVSYQFYGADSKNDPGYELYQGLAWQQGVRAQLISGDWLWKAELLATKAEGIGTYLPRLTRGYANSQGALEYWWDSRSDWNNDGETAIYSGVWYQLSSFNLPDWQIGASAAYGWGAKRWVDQQQDHQAKDGKESAWNIDIIYAANSGILDGLIARLHYTHYRNHQDDKGSFYYANMFTSERDIKLEFSLPIDFL